MIQLTRIQGEIVYVNEDNIQWIECIPDTTITFINGNRFIVKESIEEVLNRMQFNCTPVKNPELSTPDFLPTTHS